VGTRTLALAALVALGVAAWIPRARAQQPASPDAGGGSNAVEPPGQSTDAAWALYHEAFSALAQGRSDEAARLLSDLRTRYPDHEASARATPLLDSLRGVRSETVPPAPTGYDNVPPPAPPEAPRPSEAGPEQPTGTARAELVMGQTLHGILLGVEVCVAFGCEDVQPWVLSLMLGAGGGFGLSMWLSVDGVTPGLARSLNSGTEWGLWHGLMLALASSYYGSTSDEAKTVMTSMAIGQLVGLGAGGLAYYLAHPTTGQVSLTSSGGIWLTIATLLTLAFLEVEPADETSIFWTALIASDIGLVGGGLFASQMPMSAGRVLLIDAGGLLGTLLGMGIDLLAEGDDPSPKPFFGLALVGLLAGLGLSYYFTRDWDEPEPQPGAVPTQHAVERAPAATYW